jgi:hypothetical protein
MMMNKTRRRDAQLQEQSQVTSFTIPEHNALSPFDACIEACDTIAAQYHSMTGEPETTVTVTESTSTDADESDSIRRDAPEPGQSSSPSRKSNIQIKDCSVRVSPDGFLIMNPVKRRTGGRKDQLQSETSTNNNNNGNHTNGNNTNRHHSTTGAQLLDDYEDVGAGDLDLESSVVVGYDVEEGSDQTANGFTARGWSRGATTHAICQTVDAMDFTQLFCDRLSESNVDHFARHKESSRKLFDDIWEAASTDPKTSFARVNVSGNKKGETTDDGTRSGAGGGASSTSAFNSDYVSRDGSVKRAMRMGPLLQPGTTMNTALTAMEAYYSKTAQSEEARWRWETKGHPHSDSNSSNYLSSHASVMTSRRATATSVLSTLREAKIRTKERGLNREGALEDALGRAAQAQVRLTHTKEIAKQHWSSYKHAQTQMNRKLADLEQKRDTERAKRLEKERLKREAVAQQKQEKYAHAQSAAMEQEVWNMVQELAGDNATADFSPTDPHYHSSNNNTIAPIIPASRNHLVPFPTASVDGHEGQHQQQQGQGQGSNSIYNSNRAPSPDVPPVDRTALELEFGIYTKRIDATAAEDDVEDAAGALLNALSNVDNVRRAARIAAETCLLSACKAQKQCLKGMVDLERESLKERLTALDDLAQKVDDVNVRADLDFYIDHDKRYPGGRTDGCDEDDNDDGGIASALAVLNCHANGAGVMAPRFVGNSDNGRTGSDQYNNNVSASGSGSSVLEGWGSEDEQGIIGCDELEGMLTKLFFDTTFTDALLMDLSEGPSGKIQLAFKEGVDFLIQAVQEKSSKATTHRTYLCYAMNAQRGVECEVKTQVQFQGLCDVVRALLTGCTKSSGDIANAKMTMMLSQTFYIQDAESSSSSSEMLDMDDPSLNNNNDNDNDNIVARSSQNPNSRPSRKTRVYVKSTLMHHPLWADDDFWDHALFQCVSEALTKSNVMHNLQRAACVVKMGSLDCLDHDIDEHSMLAEIKWHDFLPEQRLEAASQLHVVVFAQLGALSHSMLEFGCSFDRAVNFVRRLAVRHQLPISQRTMLLQHLLSRIQTSTT